MVYCSAARRSAPPRPSGPRFAPEAEKARKNPLASDSKAIEQGEKVAKTSCVSCHGAKGKGEAVALNLKAADWTSAKGQSGSEGEILWKISNGRGAVPPWKHLAESDRWALIRYIRSLGGR